MLADFGDIQEKVGNGICVLFTHLRGSTISQAWVQIQAPSLTSYELSFSLLNWVRGANDIGQVEHLLEGHHLLQGHRVTQGKRWDRILLWKAPMPGTRKVGNKR